MINAKKVCKRHSLPDYNFPDKMLDEQSQTPFQIQP